jgi:hypothetical protein
MALIREYDRTEYPLRLQTSCIDGRAHLLQPFIPADKWNLKDRQTHRKETKRYTPQLPLPVPESASASAPYMASIIWELPDISSCQEIHHRIIAHIHGNQLWAFRVVLPTGPGNLAVVRVWIIKTVLFGSRSIQKPDLLLPAGPNLDPYLLTCGCCLVYIDPWVRISGSEFRVFYLWWHSDILLFIGNDRCLYISVIFELSGSL